MKSFLQHVLDEEKRMIVPAASGIEEPLPRGWSVKGSPISKPKSKNNSKPVKKPMTFAERLKSAQEMAKRK